MIRATAFAPATVSNVACGFDVLGFALHQPGDEVTARWTDEAEVSIDEKNDKNGPMPVAAAVTYNTGKPNNQGRVVVVGSSNWIANSFVGFNGNRDLLLNTMNWLSSDEDLISIRPKEQDDRRITLSRAQMAWVRFVSQFGLPLVIVVAGVFMWWKRR